MAKKEPYNGWEGGYETWLCSLWLDNDQGLYNYWRERTREVCDTAEAEYEFLTDKQQAVSDLAEELKDWVEDNSPLADTANLYADLLSGAISEINFHEIAEHWVDDQWEGPGNREADDA